MTEAIFWGGFYGIPRCCIDRYNQASERGEEPARLYGVVVRGEDRDAAFVPCPMHKFQPPAGYRYVSWREWDTVDGIIGPDGLIPFVAAS